MGSVKYEDNWYSQIGKTIFCHPLAYRSGPMRTAEAAVQYFRNEGIDFDTLVLGHTHRIGSYRVGSATMFEQGACCDTRQLHYADGKLTFHPNEGFLYLEQDEFGQYVSHKQVVIR